jgi:hypothetical protein
VASGHPTLDPDSAFGAGANKQGEALNLPTLQNTQFPVITGKVIIRTRNVFPGPVNDFGNICDHAGGDYDNFNP